MEAAIEAPAQSGRGAEAPPGPPASTGEAEAEAVGQYVTFYIEQEFFAFPLASVLEIIRVPETVKVPMAPKGLLGLANLRGTVLPILDLRRILALSEQGHTDATRVVVTDVGTPVGLVVDRVAQVLNVERDRIETTEALQSTVKAELMTGVVKDVAGHSLVQLLDVQRCVSLELDAVVEQSRAAARAADRAAGGAAAAQEDEEDDSVQIVSFVVDGQEYAFPIQDVQEIVRVPEVITRVPRADANVLGLMNLRNRLLPLVGMRRIFGLGESEHSDTQRIIVVTLRGEGQGAESVGIVVDQLREVLRVDEAMRDEMPSILARGRNEAQIQYVCRLEEGKRLVSVLSSAALFQHKVVKAAMDATQAEEHEGQARAAAQDADGEEDERKLVVFVLAGQEYGVMVESVREIIRVPEKMSRVPKTAQFIEGMVNLRGAVLPVLDMRARFGITGVERNERQRILVFNEGHGSTGFIVDSVSEVLRLTGSVIERAPRLSEAQARIMGRVANLKEQKRMIQILEVKELLTSEEQVQLTQAEP